MNATCASVDRAIQALKEQRPQEAADLLKDHIWRDPTDSAAYAFLGMALSELGDCASALEALERAHYLAPQDAGVLYNYGLVLEAAGRPKEARIRFSAALQLDPGYHRAHQRLLQLGGPFPPVPPGVGQSPRPTGASTLLLPSGPTPEPDRAPPTNHPGVEVSPGATAAATTAGSAFPDVSAGTEPPTPATHAEVSQPTRKWVRERPAEKPTGPGTAVEPRSIDSPSSPPIAPPPLVHSPRPAAAQAPFAEAESPSPGSASPVSAPSHPLTPRAIAGPPAPLLARGAELLQNRGVLAGLCVLFTTGGLVVGIAIRGALPGTAPRVVDPLQSAGLRRGNLAGRSLAGLDLTNAGLEGEKMAEVQAEKVNLTGARLAGADLHESKLTGANLNRADLSKADLRRADLAGARLSEARLTGVFMRGAYLKAATLRGANLQQAYLSAANLVRADLTGATLTDADLRGANLTEAVLVDVILNNAQLQGANLTRARLERTVLKEARYDVKTRWPAGFNPKLRGALLVTPTRATPSSASTAPVGTSPAGTQ